jgi:hypothetical protein
MTCTQLENAQMMENIVEILLRIPSAHKLLITDGLLEKQAFG